MGTGMDSFCGIFRAATGPYPKPHSWILFNVCFNIILSSTPRFSYFKGFQLQFYMHFPTPPFVLHAAPISCSCFNRPNYTCRKKFNYEAPHYAISYSQLCIIILHRIKIFKFLDRRKKYKRHS